MPKKRKPPRRKPGEGTIVTRPDGLLMLQVSLGTDADGKRIRKTAYGHSTEEVLEARDRILDAHQKQHLIGKADQKLGDFLDSWLKGQLALAPNTYVSYERKIRLHIRPKLGHLTLGELTPQHVQQFLDELSRSGGKAKGKEGKPQAPRTVGYCRAVLRAALADAVKWGTIVRNPAALADAPKVQRANVAPLSLDEVKQVIEAAEDHRLRALWVVMVGMGLRPGEAIGLRWQDVDLKHHTLTVAMNLQRAKGELDLRETKTGNAVLLPLPAFVAAALRDHPRTSEFVFTNTRGKPLDRHQVWRAWSNLLEDAGVDHHRPYDLRHTCASLLYELGVPEKTISEILRHATIRQTMDTYTHLRLHTTRVAADALDDAFGSSLAVQNKKPRKAG